MRTFVSLILAALILACPQLCRAEALGCCDDHAEAGSPNDSTPLPLENEAASCICAGAIRDSSSRVVSHTTLGDWSSDLSPLAVSLFVSWTVPQGVRSGSPPGRPGGGPIRIHLMLRNLRC